MSTTPGKTRLSGIPTPGRTSSIPTPGRLRSTSNALQHPSNHTDDDFAAKAFQDAIRANNPGQHRSTNTAESASLSPPTSTYPSGRRSVAARPSSSASFASSVSQSRNSDVGTTASYVRPLSRTSDVFARSSSRAGRGFEVGDNVRIESLGFEGILKYIGEIDGKSGLWAGVELSGGFSGKGKNDGTVNGKQYFSCPPYCGVFVATTKLSPPTVGSGAFSRPSSVASTRNGRITPSLSGRITPSASTSLPNGRKTSSLANGRATPSVANGRVTPAASAGRRTPGISQTAARSRATAASYALKTPSRTSSTESNITPGSRASKYVGMTAKQLSTRGSGTTSPTRKSMGTTSPTRSFGLSSPVQSALHLPSPTRPIGSPFNTPKAGRVSGIGVGVPSGTPSKSRPSMNTPKARVPSAIAMPPPASPSQAYISSRSVSLSDSMAKSFSAPGEHESSSTVSDLELNGRSLQDKIAALMSGRASSASDIKNTSRPTSSASVFDSNNTELQSHIDRLQARLDTSENENRRLRAAVDTAEAMMSSRVDVLTEERVQSQSRVAELETTLRTTERLAKERDAAIESLERAAQEAVRDIEKVRNDGEAHARDIQSRLEDKEALVMQLKELVDAKEGEQSQNDAVLEAKNVEISLLATRVQKAYAELEEERRELGGQVHELRKAGQETIALYEERLSAADSRRYEMEDLITTLEEQVRAQARPPSPTSVARHASSAAEIDNESLREQVQHLQKKISSLEDLLEDARLTSEKDELAVRDRIKRYKEREDVIRQEVNDSRKEVERVVKSEERARSRVEEIEEALRENTVALENARAEIEGLRTEIAHLEGIASGTSGTSPSRSGDRTQLLQEVAQLKQQLAESVIAGGSGDQELIRADKVALEQTLAKERQTVQDLRQQLQERSSELDAARKKLNREMPISGLQESPKPMPSSPSKYDFAAAKEEIKGLKHIVQELQKENAAAAQRNRSLEAENKLLMSETEQLRDDMKTLEDNVEQSLLREEQELAAETDGTSDDASTLQQSLRDMKVKHEAELEQLRKRLSEGEMKNARTTHQLNKEIGELETLIESKIYREDELEREVERLQDKLARSQKKTSKNGLPDESDRNSLGRQGSLAHQSASNAGGASEEVCEICERPGHDIFTCDLLKDDSPTGTRNSIASISSDSTSELFCEDCEERGHTASTCPHSLDVF